MKKEEFRIEYVFDKASKTSLWDYLSTSAGLAEWFADDVSIEENKCIFTWNYSTMEADIVGINHNYFIRFHWVEDENQASYFEFRLHRNELTGGIMLEITDFAEDAEKADAINLWDSQIRSLKRILGL
jgi:uncharacterized protein YndB with AHSA1/START domain